MLSKQNRFNLIANNWQFVLTLIRVKMLLAVVTLTVYSYYWKEITAMAISLSLGLDGQSHINLDHCLM